VKKIPLNRAGFFVALTGFISYIRTNRMHVASSSVYTFGSVEYDLSSRTHVMGVLNVTPDSFSDGGKFFTVDDAVRRGMKMVEEGADFIDVGGESTRPGSEPISIEEELRRVIPVIGRLAGNMSVPISIDTYKHEVAHRALEEGAVIVNDISGLHADAQIADVVSEHRASLILMHIKGTPKTMQQNPEYDDVLGEVTGYLMEGISIARRKGVEQLFVDPGIGFGKRLDHNLEIFRRLSELRSLGYPVLVGPSRKSFIAGLLDLPVDQRLEGTAAAVAISVMNGADVVRVHDVREMKRVVKIVDAVLKKPTP
jgi:dihydropteroate synthase